MRPEDKLLFACARQNFLSTHRETVLDIGNKEKICWDVVYSAAMLHGVASLIYANLLKCIANANLRMPQDIIDKFKLCVATNIVRKDRRAEKIVEVLSFFKRKSIDVMLIKGAALDILVYDQPWYMISSDVDLIVRRRREDMAKEDKKEIASLLHNLSIECEYFRHHDVDMDRVLPINFQKIWDNATRITWRGCDVFVMSPEDMLLSVCLNSCRKRFFRLKALCDIAEIINKYRDLKWDELTRNAREYDCNNIIYAAILITKMTVGCNLPEGALEKLADSKARAAIIRYLISRVSRGITLSSSFPYFKKNKRNKLMRKAHWALILPYATYRWYQVWRKMKHIWKTKPWS